MSATLLANNRAWAAGAGAFWSPEEDRVGVSDEIVVPLLSSKRPTRGRAQITSTYEFIEYPAMTSSQGKTSVIMHPLSEPIREQFAPPKIFPDLLQISFSKENWHVRLNRRITELSSLEKDWNGFESVPPNQRAVRMAREVLSLLHNMGTEPDRLVASADDGIAFSFRRSDRYANIECLNSGEIYTLWYDDATEPVTHQIATDEICIREAISLINGFISR